MPKPKRILNRLPAAEVEEAVRMRDGGKPVSEIADHFRVSRQAMYGLLSRRGRKPEPREKSTRKRLLAYPDANTRKVLGIKKSGDVTAALERLARIEEARKP